MKFDKLLNKLNKTFPELNAVDAIEFYGHEQIEAEQCIWFKGSECGYAPDGLPLFNYYIDFGIHRDTDGVHPKLEKILTDNGFYSEPYDAGTLMAGRI